MSGGSDATRPPRPPTRRSAVAAITSVKGSRMAACRKSVITTAQSPPITQ
jgi:hypothetical protein